MKKDFLDDEGGISQGWPRAQFNLVAWLQLTITLINSAPLGFEEIPWPYRRKKVKSCCRLMRRDSWYLQKEEIKSFALGLIINISSKESMVYTNDCRDILSKLTSSSLLDNNRKQPGGNRCGECLLWQKNNSHKKEKYIGSMWS